MENEVTRITLTDENGEETEFDVITKLDIEDKEYLVVIPFDKNENDDDDDEAIILRIDNDVDGEEVLCTVEDDDEFKVVCEAYESLFSGDNELN